MNLNHLALFDAVAQAGSVSAGAERMAVSQPAVSRQLAEFERCLGVRLFDRLPRGIRLTEAGELLARFARQVFALVQSAEQALEELRGLERGRLAIGASTTIGSYWLPAVLAKFHRTYPGIHVSLDIGNTEAIQKRLLDGTLDVGLTEGFVDMPGLDARVFRTDELVPIVPAFHPFARARSLTLARFCQEPFLLRESGSGTRSVIERALAGRGVTIRPIIELGSSEAIKQAVAAGMGVAIISRLAANTDRDRGRFVVVTLRDFTLQRSLHLLQGHGRHVSAAQRAFIAALD